MSDKKPEDEFDWTQALADWAHTTFAPEPAERKRTGPPTRSRAPSIPQIDPSLLPDLNRKSGPPPRYPVVAPPAVIPDEDPDAAPPRDEPSTRTLYRSSASLRAAKEREARAAEEESPGSDRTAQFKVGDRLLDDSSPELDPPTDHNLDAYEEPEPEPEPVPEQEPAPEPLREVAAEAEKPEPAPDSALDVETTNVLAGHELPVPVEPPPPVVPPAPAVAQSPKPSAPEIEPYELDDAPREAPPSARLEPADEPTQVASRPDSSARVDVPPAESLDLRKGRVSKVPGTSALGALLGGEPSDDELDALLEGFPNEAIEAAPPAAAPARAPTPVPSPPPAPVAASAEPESKPTAKPHIAWPADEEEPTAVRALPSAEVDAIFAKSREGSAPPPAAPTPTASLEVETSSSTSEEASAPADDEAHTVDLPLPQSPPVPKAPDSVTEIRAQSPSAERFDEEEVTATRLPTDGLRTGTPLGGIAVQPKPPFAPSPSAPPVPPAASAPPPAAPAPSAPSYAPEEPQRPLAESQDIIQVTASEVDAAEIDELEALMRASEPPAPREQAQVASWGADVGVADWVAGPAREAFAARAQWLEDEARRNDDRAARARGLLVVSELRAMVGQKAAATALAREARELLPQLALAHRQLRGLTGSSDGGAFLDVVDQSLRATPNPSAKMHDALLAADALRLGGDDDAARKRYEQAARIGAQDARLVLARAGMALARGETTSIALRIPEAEGLVPFSRAAAAALRLRGIELRGAAFEASASEPIRRARGALEKGELGKAATALEELFAEPDLARPLRWVCAALHAAAGDATRASHVLRELGGVAAQRALAARGIESGQRDMVLEALRDPNAFSPPEQLVLQLLIGAEAEEVRMLNSVVASMPDMGPLAAAAAGVKTPLDGHVAGEAPQKHETHLGRLLASDAASHAIAAAVETLAPSEPDMLRALVLDAAHAANRFGPIAQSLSQWGGDAPPAESALAAAIVAERGGDRTSARDAFRVFCKENPKSLLAIRALAELDEQHDEPARLRARADALGAGVPAAVTYLELFARIGVTEEGIAALEAAQNADDTLALPALLLERAARRRGDLERVVSAIRARRPVMKDPMEVALDGVREALLIADTEPGRAGELLAEAHAARPDDVALRDLYERLTNVAPEERAAWRERKAEKSTGLARAVWLYEAARFRDQAHDLEGAQKTAVKLAAVSTSPLAKLTLDRADENLANVERLTEELMTRAKGASEGAERREIFERLAELDTIRKDMSGAMLWHRSVLEDAPEYLPSLRYLEHVLVSESREDELESIATTLAKRLGAEGGGEAVAHAALAAWLRARAGDHASVHELAAIAREHATPPLWSLRVWNAHARATSAHAEEYQSASALLARTQRGSEQATLLVRMGDAALRSDDRAGALAAYERAVALEPGDVSIWEKLADARRVAGDIAGAAEALESIARTSQVKANRIAAWREAAIAWGESAGNKARARTALEQAAAIDLAWSDVFSRLCAIYTESGAKPELAALLEKRAAGGGDENERLALAVERGRLLTEIGEPEKARAALESALAIRPDHAGALDAYADLCAQGGDHTAAEQAYVRLARLLSTPEEQRDVYHKLGTLYADHLGNLSRAELAFREVLKRAPGDLPTLRRLVGIYAKQNDAARALEIQNELLLKAEGPIERRDRLVELSQVHETVSRDLRKAEQVLEAARRESPQDVGLLRALAEFYTRHKQLPAVHILLDRTAGDVRRALGAGRFAPAAFEIMTAVYELRGHKDAASLVGASLAAIEGRPASLPGAEAKAGNPDLDDLLAPELASSALRLLLARTGEALDVLAPVDLKKLAATPMAANHPAAAMVQGLARAMNVPSVQVHVSAQLGMMCVPVSTSPAAVVVGEALMRSDNVLGRAFLFARALKLVQARAGALVRIPPKDVPGALAGFFRVFNPTWEPPNVPAPVVNEATRRLQAAMRKGSEPDLGILALEAAGGIFTDPSVPPNVGPSLLAWANRAALLAVGDPNAALDAMAWSAGMAGGAPTGEARAPWIARTAEARELLVFSLSDAYAEARKRCGLGGGPGPRR